MAMMRLSVGRRLFASNPVQSFGNNSPIAALHAADSTTARPFAGLDMNKIHQFKFENTLNPKIKFPRSGYQNLAFSMPSIDAMTDKEISAFFQTYDYKKRHSIMQLLQYAKGPFSFITAFHLLSVLCFVPFVAFVLYLQKWEPMEVHIDADEYFKDFKWHCYGPHLDHHAYEQYLEARRAVKWRHAEIDPRDWIPEQYKEKE